MNEQILELAKRSGLKSPTETALSPAERMFAELIVRECIDVMKQNDYHGEWLGERIKEHFGVKE